MIKVKVTFSTPVARNYGRAIIGFLPGRPSFTVDWTDETLDEMDFEDECQIRGIEWARDMNADMADSITVDIETYREMLAFIRDLGGSIAKNIERVEIWQETPPTTP